jgi:hypothetical protein
VCAIEERRAAATHSSDDATTTATNSNIGRPPVHLTRPSDGQPLNRASSRLGRRPESLSRPASFSGDSFHVAKQPISDYRSAKSFSLTTDGTLAAMFDFGDSANCALQSEIVRDCSPGVLAPPTLSPRPQHSTASRPGRAGPLARVCLSALAAAAAAAFAGPNGVPVAAHSSFQVGWPAVVRCARAAPHSVRGRGSQSSIARFAAGHSAREKKLQRRATANTRTGHFLFVHKQLPPSLPRSLVANKNIRLDCGTPTQIRPSQKFPSIKFCFTQAKARLVLSRFDIPYCDVALYLERILSAQLSCYSQHVSCVLFAAANFVLK